MSCVEVSARIELESPTQRDAVKAMIDEFLAELPRRVRLKRISAAFGKKFHTVYRRD